MDAEECGVPFPLQWRHNGPHGIPNHQSHHCLLNRLFRSRSKKTSKFRVTGLCAGNSPVTGEFPAQLASYTENVSSWWCHHAMYRPSLLNADTPMINIRWSWDHLIFIMGILVMVRQHLYTEMDPVVHFYWHCLLEIRAWIFNHIPYLFESRYCGELKCNCFSINKYCHISDIRHTLLGNKIIHHSDVVGASPTTSSFVT